MTPSERDPKKETIMKPEASMQKDTPVFDSGTLFSGKKEVHIKHGETVYRLAITRFDKLILTK